MFEKQKRFWNKVKTTNNFEDCWLWIAGKDKDGYGKLRVQVYLMFEIQQLTILRLVNLGKIYRVKI